MLQPLDIALHPMLDVLHAAIAIQNYLVGEMVEVNFVAFPAAVETKKQDNRATHHSGKQDWAGRKCSWRTQELTSRDLAAARDTVAQHSNKGARIEALFDP